MAGYVWSLKDNIPYAQHAQNNRYILEMKNNTASVSRQNTRAILKAQKDASRSISSALTHSSQAQEQNMKNIHSAIISQNELMHKESKNLQHIEDGIDRLSDDMQHLASELSTINQNLIYGFSGLKASVDMLASTILSQFEMQREEIKVGFDNIINILETSKETEALERYHQATKSFKQFLNYPEHQLFLDNSIEYLDESIRIYKMNPYAYLYLGHSYKEPSDKFNPILSQKNYETCAIYAKGSEDKSLASLGYFLSGWMSYVNNNVSHAIELTEQSIYFDDKSYPEAYYNLAKYYANIGDAEKSLSNLNIAITKFDPEYSIKPYLDNDFKNIKTELDKFSITIRDKERERLLSKLKTFNIT
jgi:tetratricopeptide (TPR) repeat protein